MGIFDDGYQQSIIDAARQPDGGFIDEPDPALLKDVLERDLSGAKIHSTSGDFFERKMDLEIEREFQRGQRKRRVTMMS